MGTTGIRAVGPRLKRVRGTGVQGCRLVHMRPRQRFDIGEQRDLSNDKIVYLLQRWSQCHFCSLWPLLSIQLILPTAVPVKFLPSLLFYFNKLFLFIDFIEGMKFRMRKYTEFREIKQCKIPCNYSELAEFKSLPQKVPYSADLQNFTSVNIR